MVEIYIFLVSLVLIVLLFGLVQFSYDKISKLISRYIPGRNKLDFETDILFLDYICSFYLQKRLYDFEVLHPGIDRIVNKNYKYLLEQIVTDVTNALSDDYLAKLRNYFDPEALITYITHHIDLDLTKIILQKNEIKE